MSNTQLKHGWFGAGASLLLAVMLPAQDAFERAGQAAAVNEPQAAAEFALPAPAILPAGTTRVEPDAFSQHFLLNVWETDDGLPQNSATSVAQTPDGFLWVGTFGGLARFDGQEFTVTSQANHPLFTTDSFERLFSDRQGRLWAGLQNQLACLQDGQWRVYSRTQGAPAGRVRSFAQDPEGHVWMTAGSRFFRWAGERFTEVPGPGVPSETSYVCVVDGRGRLWAMGSRFFGQREGNQWISAQPTPKVVGGFFEGLAASRSGGVWLADRTHFRHFEGTNCTRQIQRPAWFQGTGPVSLWEDTRGLLWAGGFNKGLLMLDVQGRAYRCGKAEGLQNIGIRCVFEDREGNIWVGTDGGGLARIKPRLFRVYGEEAGLRQQIVNGVTEESPGQMLVASYGGGLVRFDVVSGTFSPAVPSQDIRLHPDSLVLTVLKDKAGVIWAGTYDEGLFRIQDGAVQRIPPKETDQRRITALYQGPSGFLWIGTDGGLVSYDGRQFVRYGTNAGLPLRRVIALAEDQAGTLWVGTTRGLYRKQGPQFEPVGFVEGETNRRILALHCDRDGALWVGTRDRGLARLRDGAWFHFREEHGLPAPGVTCILDDESGHLWLATIRYGVVRVSRAALEAVALGARPQVEGLLRFDKNDGLRTLEMHYSTQPVGWRSQDGQLWFSTLKGLAVVNPARVSVNQLPPPVHLLELRLDGQSVPLTNPPGTAIHLPPSPRRLQIRYTAPSFVAPAKMRFQYRLHGLDKDWIEAGTRRVAEFSDLRPGQYRFEVRAANNDGVWNTAGASLAFVKPPLFWRTNWFRGLVLFVVAGGVGGLVWRIQQVRLLQTSERRRHEEVLRSTEARYQALFESTSDGILIIEAEGPDAGRIVSANPAAAAMHGYTLDELLRLRIQDLDGPAAREKTGGQIVRPKEGEKLQFELEHRRKDGTCFPVEITTNLMRVGDRPFVLAIDRDITARKKAEEAKAHLEAQLRRAQKLEAIGTLAGGIAHDFNNILTGIIGNAEMARLELAGHHPSREYIGEVLKAAQRARESISQILTFSRQKERKRSLIQLWPVVQEALKLLRASLPATLEIRTVVPPVSPAVLADPSQVYQIIMNLGTNAAHAIGPRPGVIEVAQTIVQVDAAHARTQPQLREGRYVRLSVSDTGHGMDTATLERVFEPFFTTKPPGEGTGLGLAVVHGIMQDHEGAITIESQVGKGTTFHLYFPATASQVSDTTTNKTDAPRGAGQHILFVDDEPGVAQLGSTLLKRLGYQVTAFTNSEEALAAFRAAPRQFALVITDLTMPRLTGNELAQRLLETRPDTPILLTTGYSASMDTEKARQFGFRDLVPKPFTLVTFAEVVHKTLAQHSPRGAVVRDG
jgi:PAS domain S-box-containing protein